MNTDPLKPGTTLLCKLGSIARHVEEASGPGGHPLDEAAIQSLLSDQEVNGWLGAMDTLALLPVKRNA
jgi:hypothetical protein